MSCFALKNVLLFVLILLIVHVLIKNALLERGASTVNPEKTDDASRTTPDAAASEPERQRSAQKAQAALAAAQRARADEEELMRYVREGDGTNAQASASRAADSLSASWTAHRLPHYRSDSDSRSDSYAAMPPPPDLGDTSRPRAPYAVTVPTPAVGVPLPSGATSLSSGGAPAGLPAPHAKGAELGSHAAESQMNGGRLFADADNGLATANAFDSNYQAF